MRVFCLMKQIDLMAIFPQPNLSKANKEQKIFSYLLGERMIDKVNEVWSTGHHLYPHVVWLSLPSAHHGLTHPLCVELALIKYFR